MHSLKAGYRYLDLVIHGPSDFSEQPEGGYTDIPEISIDVDTEYTKNTFSVKVKKRWGPWYGTYANMYYEDPTEEHPLIYGPWVGNKLGQYYTFPFKVAVTIDKGNTYTPTESDIKIRKDRGVTTWSTDEEWSDTETFNITTSGKHTINIWFWADDDTCPARGEWRKAAEISHTFTLSVTATFKANGGSWSDGDTQKTQQVDYGSHPSNPGNPSRTGYRFKGWDKSLSTPIYDNETYTAQWVAQSTLKVNPNGGTWNGHTTTQTYTKDAGSTQSVPNPTGSSVTVTFQPNGGTWQSSPTTGTRTKSANRSFDSWTKSSPFYGSLSGTTYTFGSTANVTSTITAKYGGASITTYSSSDITQEGWLLKGWTDGNSVYSPGATISPTANLTLTAVWKTSPIMKYDGTKWVPWVSPGSNLSNVDLVWTRNSSGSWERKGKIYRYNGTSWVQILGKEK